MYEFGEELIIESYKVPWLIWIQLIVMVLLIILLFFGFTVFSLDPPASNQSTHNTAAASSSSATASRQSHVNNSSSLPNISGSSRNTTVEEIQNIKGNVGASTSREMGAQQVQAREGSSTKDVSFRPFQRPEHPCHFLGLAKQAFFKCLGLDSSCESSNDRTEHMKND